MNNNKNKGAGNVMGGKTVRACDSCICKRARWYCTADDAFLCQGCDAMVHSANLLANRHERVRICSVSDDPPAWYQGFKRKARSPRRPKFKPARFHHPIVPEIGSEDGSFDEPEDVLLYSVPVIDPLSPQVSHVVDDEVFNCVNKERTETEGNMSFEFDNLTGFFPSETELTEFAADVECLLGGGIDENGEIEKLGVLDCKEEDVCFEDTIVKVKEEDNGAVKVCGTMSEWRFDYELPVAEEEEKRKMVLRLNYENVISSWASQGSPWWTTGSRPEVNHQDDYWPASMDMDVGQAYQDMVGGQMRIGDGDREAKVSRYREKRSTRLFAKKIRYQVRKLNAEKRPRMKGRFVKRTAFP